MMLIANGSPSDAGHVAHLLGGALLGQIRSLKPDQGISACRNMLYNLLRMLLSGVGGAIVEVSTFWTGLPVCQSIHFLLM